MCNFILFCRGNLSSNKPNYEDREPRNSDNNSNFPKKITINLSSTKIIPQKEQRQTINNHGDNNGPKNVAIHSMYRGDNIEELGNNQ